MSMLGRIVLAGLVLAVAGCAGSRRDVLDPHQVQYRSLMSRATDAYRTGALPRATDLYRRALALAQIADEPREIADAAYNLAVCAMEQGDYDGAGALLAEALAAADRARGDGRDIRLVQAKLARLQDRPADAERLAQEVAKASPGASDQAFLASAVLTDVACDRGQVPVAKEHLARTASLAGRKPPALFSAELARLRGRVLLLEQQPAQAAQAFSEEASWAQQTGSFRRMARALARAGAAYRAAGDWRQAGESFHRAARSLWPTGAADLARALAVDAVDCARRADDPALLLRATALLQRIDEVRHAATQPASAPEPIGPPDL